MEALTVLRYVNVVVAAAVGLHLVITGLSYHHAVSWSLGRPPVRFLRLGTGSVLLTVAYGTANAMADNVPPSETTWIMTVALLWAATGTVWSVLDDRKARRASNPPPDLTRVT